MREAHTASPPRVVVVLRSSQWPQSVPGCAARWSWLQLLLFLARCPLAVVGLLDDRLSSASWRYGVRLLAAVHARLHPSVLDSGLLLASQLVPLPVLALLVIAVTTDQLHRFHGRP